MKKIKSVKEKNKRQRLIQANHYFFSIYLHITHIEHFEKKKKQIIYILTPEDKDKIKQQYLKLSTFSRDLTIINSYSLIFKNVPKQQIINRIRIIGMRKQKFDNKFNKFERQDARIELDLSNLKFQFIDFCRNTWPEIQILNLSNCQLENADLLTLKQRHLNFLYLKKLNLSDNKISNILRSHLNKFYYLNQIIAKDCPLDEDSIKFIQSIPSGNQTPFSKINIKLQKLLVYSSGSEEENDNQNSNNFYYMVLIDENYQQRYQIQQIFRQREQFSKLKKIIRFPSIQDMKKAYRNLNRKYRINQNAKDFIILVRNKKSLKEEIRQFTAKFKIMLYETKQQFPENIKKKSQKNTLASDQSSNNFKIIKDSQFSTNTVQNYKNSESKQNKLIENDKKIITNISDEQIASEEDIQNQFYWDCYHESKNSDQSQTEDKDINDDDGNRDQDEAEKKVNFDKNK